MSSSWLMSGAEVHKNCVRPSVYKFWMRCKSCLSKQCVELSIHMNASNSKWLGGKCLPVCNELLFHKNRPCSGLAMHSVTQPHMCNVAAVKLAMKTAAAGVAPRIREGATLKVPPLMTSLHGNSRLLLFVYLTGVYQCREPQIQHELGPFSRYMPMMV